MIRTIKFKARVLKCLSYPSHYELGDWVFGDLSRNFDGEYQISIPVDTSQGCLVYIVDENTICQFVGIFDKNKKEIYENDILKTYYGLEYVVKYLAPEFVAVMENDWSQQEDDMTELEVIGNIHDRCK